MERRKFLGNAALLAAGSGIASALPTNIFGMPRNLFAVSDTINIGAIGLNSMGWFDLSSTLENPGVRCIALCDVDHNVLAKRVDELAKKGIKVTAYTDYRKLLENKDIDAVIIGTPDHWHCLIMTDACKAGKDVYVEKPVGNSIVECDIMTATAQKYKRVVQVGQWQRSQHHFADAIAFIHSGKLGKVRVVKAWSYIGWKSTIPVKPDSPVPPGVDYKQWLGPAPTRPFNENRFHFNFRWFWDYAGGLMTDWGVHLLDYAVMGMNAGIPKSIIATGGKFAYPDDAQQTPDTMTTIYEYDDFYIQWEHAMGIGNGLYNRDHGIAFIGNNGTLILNRSGWEVVPETKDNVLQMQAIPMVKPTDNPLQLHTKNFLDVIRTRKVEDLKTPIESGAHIAKIAHMGNISYRTGEKLHWDAAKKEFTNANANQYLSKVYHNGYQLPKV